MNIKELIEPFHIRLIKQTELEKIYAEYERSSNHIDRLYKKSKHSYDLAEKKQEFFRSKYWDTLFFLLYCKETDLRNVGYKRMIDEYNNKRN